MAQEKRDTLTRQEEIVNAALTVIRSHGMTGLSVARIAKEVGLVPSAIYRHFTGIDQIAEEILRLLARRLAEQSPDPEDFDRSSLDCLSILFRRHLDFFRDNAPLYHIICAGSFGSTNGSGKKLSGRLFETYLKEVSNVIRSGREDGSIRTDVPVDAMTALFWGAVQSAVRQREHLDQIRDASDFSDAIWQLFKRSVAAEPQMITR